MPRIPRLGIVALLCALPTLHASAAPAASAAPLRVASSASDPSAEEAPPAVEPPPRVALETRLGRVVIELDPVRAPRTVANFLAHVDAGHYSGTIFHRVVPSLLVQGGAYTPDLQPKPERAPVPLESDNGLSNVRGAVAAARRPDRRDSATSQFFINLVDNPQFDAIDPDGDVGAGYAVFGRVVEGMDVLDRIGAVETGPQGPFPARVPVTPIIIERAARIDSE